MAIAFSSMQKKVWRVLTRWICPERVLRGTILLGET